MSKNLFFNRRFWQDQYITDLDPIEKLLFIYLITNPYCALTGIYEASIKHAALETGLDAEIVRKILSRFHDDGKVFTIDSWFCVKNYPRYQKFSGVKLEKGIINELKAIPSHILLQFIEYGYPIDTLSILSSDSDSESESENRLEKIKKLIMTWRHNRYGDDYIEGDIQIDPDHKPKKKEKKVPDEVQQVFDLFDNPAKAIWRLREIEREAAKALYATYGIETLKLRVDRIQQERDNKDPMFPLVTTPSQLLDKMPNIERYFNV